MWYTCYSIIGLLYITDFKNCYTDWNIIKYNIKFAQSIKYTIII